MRKRLHLFEGFGIELEYMIVDKNSLDVMPLADLLLRDSNGEICAELEFGELAWCNELVKHVIEIKTNGPAGKLGKLTSLFQSDIWQINQKLEEFGACLMPTAMHPWMDPWTQTSIWDHEYSAIYESFNSIFDCRGHGWSNLQSTHLNLPFGNDEEFGRLHAAIRAVLPILPVLSASSPIMDGKPTGILDSRLSVYRNNAKRVPSVSGKVIPEAWYTEKDYREKLLQPIYDDIAPLDPDGILQDEWLNARGAIARFDRNAIEIRVLDIQESPAVDIAILSIIVSVIHALTRSRWHDIEIVKHLDIDELNEILLQTTSVGGDAVIASGSYLEVFGLSDAAITARELWQHLLSELKNESYLQDASICEIISHILSEGNLATRILRKTGANPTHQELKSVYLQLCDCLQTGKMFS